jgi:hypothetical protein
LRARRPLAALAAASLALTFAAGCGGDDEPTTRELTVDPTASTSTTSSSSTTSSISTESTTTRTLDPTTTTLTESTTTKESTAPSYDPSKPDSEDNDKPPKSGSPQEAFEQACEADPSSCG